MLVYIAPSKFARGLSGRVLACDRKTLNTKGRSESDNGRQSSQTSPPAHACSGSRAHSERQISR